MRGIVLLVLVAALAGCADRPEPVLVTVTAPPPLLVPPPECMSPTAPFPKIPMQIDPETKRAIGAVDKDVLRTLEGGREAYVKLAGERKTCRVYLEEQTRPAAAGDKLAAQR